MKLRLAAVGTPARAITSLAKAFEASRRAAVALGPNTAPPPARRAQRVGEAGGEGRLGADDGEIDSETARRGDQGVHVGRGDRQIGAEVGGAGVAWRREQGRVGVVALQRPTERVLAAAPADDQNLHFFLNASEKAWAARLAVSTTSSTTALASFI